MSRGSSGRILSIGQKLSSALAEPDRQIGNRGANALEGGHDRLW